MFYSLIFEELKKCAADPDWMLKQVRGFAPIGMSEYWNIGKMGFGILVYWVNGIMNLTIKLKLENILYFHHIPLTNSR